MIVRILLHMLRFRCVREIGENLNSRDMFELINWCAAPRKETGVVSGRASVLVEGFLSVGLPAAALRLQQVITVRKKKVSHVGRYFHRSAAFWGARYRQNYSGIV